MLPRGDPGEVLAAMGFLDIVDAHAAEVIGIADAQRQAALAEQRRAAAVLAEARARADEVGARVAELEAAAGAVTEELDAALGEVDRQLARLQQGQVEVNERTAASWQAYLAELAAAGVAAPPAAALGSSPRGLPPRMVPVAAADGTAQRGAAQVPRQPSSLLVLPAETLAADTAAMGELGLPCAPGTAGSRVVVVRFAGAVGPPAFRCPETRPLFAETTAVAPADVLPADLIFLRTADAGLGHVGIALDPRTMLAADARADAVVVRGLPGEQVLGIGRPSLGTPAPVAAPEPSGGALRMSAGTPSG